MKYIELDYLPRKPREKKNRDNTLLLLEKNTSTFSNIKSYVNAVKC